MHIMVDIESLSLRPDAVVRSIGAVAFDAAGVHYDFYTLLDMDDQVRRGRHIDPGTVLWWMEQSAEARAAFIGYTRVPQMVPEGLAAFAHFLNKHLDPRSGLWGNGAAFDNVVLRSLYQDYGRDVPWSFRQDYCYRTIKAMPGLAGEAAFVTRAGVHHDALDDARHQAMVLLHLNAKKPGIL